MNSTFKIFIVAFAALSTLIYAGFKAENNALTEISACMQSQQASWNSGNLEAYMSCYWKSDSLQFVGKKGPQYGWQQTLSNYKKSYPNAEAMGKLQFANLKMTPLCEQYVYVFGKWELLRTKDTLSGYYTLIWQYIDGRWVIISDHSS